MEVALETGRGRRQPASTKRRVGYLLQLPSGDQPPTWLLPTDDASNGTWRPVRTLYSTTVDEPGPARQRQDNSDTDVSLNTINLGLNYLLQGHAINCKLDVAINDRRVAGDGAHAVRFQTQLLF